jgi:hypothetical protein
MLAVDIMQRSNSVRVFATNPLQGIFIHFHPAFVGAVRVGRRTRATEAWRRPPRRPTLRQSACRSREDVCRICRSTRRSIERQRLRRFIAHAALSDGRIASKRPSGSVSACRMGLAFPANDPDHAGGSGRCRAKRANRPIPAHVHPFALWLNSVIRVQCSMPQMCI